MALPSTTGSMRAVSELGAALREAYGTELPPEAVERLAGAFYAARPRVQAGLRSWVGGLSEEQAEEAFQEMAATLPQAFARWRGDGSFGGYLRAALKNQALSALRRQRRERPSEHTEDPVSPLPVAPPGFEADSNPLLVQALLRYVWFRYGSPDNPDRLVHAAGPASRLAMPSFIALAHRLEGRPSSELVQRLQPKPGSGYWGPDRGEVDRKWWRSRATQAAKRVQDDLQDPAERARFNQLYEALADAL